MNGKLALAAAAALIALTPVLYAAGEAGADCRPPYTLTDTDYARMAAAIDDFVSTRYRMDWAGWAVEEAEPSPAKLSAVVRVGRIPGPFGPGQPGPGAKRYSISVARECAGGEWAVGRFEPAPK